MPMKPFHRNNSPLSPRERVGVRGRLLTLACCALLSGALPAQAEISANHWAGSVIIGLDDSPCDSSRRGAIRYESVSNHHEFCDGTEWRKFVAASGSGDPSMPPADTGYFVLSAGTWNGNLGGRAGADSKCLSDLTTYDWLNKADAVSRGLLTSTKVKAFLCTNTTAASCNQALPLVTYTFAVSDSPAIGGATFTTDSDSRGPANTQNWTGVNYFGTDARYWSNRGNGSASLWPTGGQSIPGSQTCASGSAYDSNSSGWNGNTGNANSAGSNRWNDISFPCNTLQRLICMVHP